MAALSHMVSRSVDAESGAAGGGTRLEAAMSAVFKASIRPLSTQFPIHLKQFRTATGRVISAGSWEMPCSMLCGPRTHSLSRPEQRTANFGSRQWAKDGLLRISTHLLFNIDCRLFQCRIIRKGMNYVRNVLEQVTQLDVCDKQALLRMTVVPIVFKKMLRLGCRARFAYMGRNLQVNLCSS